MTEQRVDRRRSGIDPLTLLPISWQLGIYFLRNQRVNTKTCDDVGIYQFACINEQHCINIYFFDLVTF